MKPATRRVRAPAKTETDEHLTIAAYFRKVGLGSGALAIHVRNERPGDWQRIQANKMGVMPGVPDWLILGAVSPGWCEIKPRGWCARKQHTGNYTVHELRQLETHEKLRAAGCWVVIVETLDEMLTALAAHGVPLRRESITTERIRRGFENAAVKVAE